MWKLTDNTKGDIMETIKKIWNWLNGNKTVIGLFLITLLSQPWFADILPVTSTAYQILYWAAGILAAGGVAHKIVKATTEPGANS